MSSVIQVDVMGLKTPICFQSELVRFLRKSQCEAVIDVTYKNMSFDIQLNDSGLKARVGLWEQTAEEEHATTRQKESAARCLYTYHIARSGEPLFKTRIFITVRAKTGSELTAAEKRVYQYLNSIDAEKHQIIGQIKDTLEYIAILSDKKSNNIKNLKSVITSEQTLAEMQPNSGSLNSKSGAFLGINVKNGTPYKFDWKNITMARNLYLLASSGRGKTIIATNMCCSAAEEGYAVCIQDIKGNEFTNFIKSTGGYIVSLRENSAGYINSWQMHREDTTEKNADSYFRQRLAFSKEQMIILSGVTNEEDRNELEELLDSFHDAMYTSMGVIPTNRNTWIETLSLTPFDVYDKLMSYLSPQVIQRYPSVTRKVFNALRMYMSRNGSKSYIFTGEFDYAAILRANTLMFDFGLLEGTTSLQDPVIFKLKFAYMRKLNAEYIAYKFAKGIKVFKVLEKSQVAVNDLDIIKGYVEEFTLRRAQGQTTLMLGNSVSALLDSPLGKPIVENVTGLLIGNLEENAREVAIERFSLEDYADLIDEINLEDRYTNSFVFINKMERKPAVPVLRVIWNPRVQRYKVFEAVAQTNSGIS